MHFVRGLPRSHGCDAVWIVTNRLTKAHHFVLCHTVTDGAGFADLFVEYIFRLHGLPDSIVSDRSA